MNRTDVRKFFESKYLGAWDVPEGGDAVLVIDRCEAGKIKGTDGKEDKAPVLYFRNISDRSKSMVLNKTNTKVLIKLYGPFVEEWPGKRIAIYATKTSAFGQEVDCLRIRPREPQGKSATPAVAAPASEGEAPAADGLDEFFAKAESLR